MFTYLSVYVLAAILLFQGINLLGELEAPTGVVPPEVRPAAAPGARWGGYLVACGAPPGPGRAPQPRLSLALRLPGAPAHPGLRLPGGVRPVAGVRAQGELHPGQARRRRPSPRALAN